MCVSIRMCVSNWKGRAFFQEMSGWGVQHGEELLNYNSSSNIPWKPRRVFWIPRKDAEGALNNFVPVSWWWCASYRCIILIMCNISCLCLLVCCKFEELELYLYTHFLVKCGTQHCDNQELPKKKNTLPSITSGFIPHFSTLCVTACLWIAICIFSLVYSVIWVRCAIFLSMEIFPPISKGWGSACFQFLLCWGRLLITSTRAWKNRAWVGNFLKRNFKSSLHIM